MRSARENEHMSFQQYDEGIAYRHQPTLQPKDLHNDLIEKSSMQLMGSLPTANMQHFEYEPIASLAIAKG